MALNRLYYFALLFVLVTVSCDSSLGVFEKNIAIPDHEWQAGFKPEVSFEISDTTALYNLFVVIRHTHAYRYNNLWLNITTKFPSDSAEQQRLDLRLATDDQGWLGSGMDDIYEHRIKITREPVTLKAGKYVFQLEQIMRENPLQHIMNAGIRVEKSSVEL